MSNQARKIVHIVRRFGRCGGMETYVWYLSHCLLEFGYRVSIICEEQTEQSTDPRLEIIQVGKSSSKRRYRQMIHFRANVDAALTQLMRNPPNHRVLIHSHERSLRHHVTTFHGPPIAGAVMQSPWAKFNPRLKAWFQMEQQEVNARSVRYVVPVSELLSSELLKSYPEIQTKITKPGYPGVIAKQIRNDQDGRAGFVFVGSEWRRKGLDLAINWLSSMNQRERAFPLDVFGVNEMDVPARLRKFDWVRFQGWSDDVPFSRYKVLIHPARKEPFGMVVPEALAAGCAVVISDHVGAKDLYADCEQLLIGALSDSKETWGERLRRAHDQSPVNPPEGLWSWDDLGHFYNMFVYSNIFRAMD